MDCRWIRPSLIAAATVGLSGCNLLAPAVREPPTPPLAAPTATDDPARAILAGQLADLAGEDAIRARR